MRLYSFLWTMGDPNGFYTSVQAWFSKDGIYCCMAKRRKAKRLSHVSDWLYRLDGTWQDIFMRSLMSLLRELSANNWRPDEDEDDRLWMIYPSVRGRFFTGDGWIRWNNDDTEIQQERFYRRAA